jgi:uncharacterized protein involved in outer membrane biogenesis
MKALKIVCVVIVVLIVIAAGALWYATRHVNTPAFKEKLLAAARDATGADVRIGQMDVSLFSGISLKNMSVANPTGFPGNLLSADAFVLRYRLLPLLRKRVEIETLSIQKPVVTLARNAAGEWNYEKFPGSAPSPAQQPAAPSTTGAALDVALSRLALDGGAFLALDESGKPLVKIDGISLSSSVNLSGNKLAGAGKAGIEKLSVAELLFAEKLVAPVSFAGGDAKLAPLSGKLAGGEVTGEIGVTVLGGAKYAVNLQISNADMERLLQEAGVKKRVLEGGKLKANAKLTGTGGLPTIAGNGRAEIAGGQLVGLPALSLVASLLQIKALERVRFDEAVMEFAIAENMMQTPVIRVRAPDLQLDGRGSVSLADYSLNHTLTLALSQSALAGAPKEVRGIFKERADGFFTLDFKVWGPYDSPKTDLKDRLVKGATQQLLEKGLQKLFK